MRKIIRHCDKAPQTCRTLPLIATADADPASLRIVDEWLATEPVDTPPRDGLYLTADSNGLALCRALRPPVCMRAEFLRGAQGFRMARQRHQREAIARACGVGGGSCPRVVDATAGLGRDAFILAATGAQIILLERSAVVYALLVDGLRRAAGGGAEDIVSRMTAIHIEAVEWLRGHGTDEKPDTVYLDPMYKGRRRAAAGKELALLQALLGPPESDAELFEAARTAACNRVVVKRHRRAPALAGITPDYRLTGRSTRFDVYRANGGKVG
ncbi:class I SAM-dependent methyltransferase [Spiribacter insolitus]|uniref:Ribosomal RNA small subunit methyltransferase J n=1 Tax=Spiribacter insolitus TaxID=3122417 RepID=A0ABV3TAI5_9GAMM